MLPLSWNGSYLLMDTLEITSSSNMGGSAFASVGAAAAAAWSSYFFVCFLDILL